MTKDSESYESRLKESLKDPAEAAAYLDAALKEYDQEVFWLVG
jgi:DNA-binding phage protein